MSTASRPKLLILELWGLGDLTFSTPVLRAAVEKYDVTLVDFLLDGVALHPSLMQPDNIHPNAAGQKAVFENVWPVLADMLRAR